MQIIQSIRDKGAAIVIVIIALSLIGFILMDAKQGSSRLFSSSTSNIGKVNGDAIELNEYNKRVKQAQDAQERNQRQQAPPISQLREQTWNQMVAEKVFFAETNKLGIDFTSKELSSILVSNDPNNPFLKEGGMTDSATGKLDVEKAKSAISNIKKFQGEQREALNTQMIDPLTITTDLAKYTGLLNASVYYPTWMQQKEAKEGKDFATISYVSLPYSDISDSTVKVTDAEVEDYVRKHKELYKQEEESRSVSYVAFSQLPAKEDSAAAEKQVADLKNSFASDTNSNAFLARNISTIEYSDEFLPKTKITSPVKDTLATLPVGSVYGPYLDKEKNSYVLAKVIATKELPDSVKARHILIPVNDAQTGKQINEDTVAKKRADSIYAAINAGADFAAMALQFSSDGSKTKGGDLGTFGYGTMVPEFNEFSFTKPAGSKGVVKTQFGYHIIEVLNQKDFKPAYKIAYMGKEITASEATINAARLEAIKASAEKTSSRLSEYVTKHGLKMIPVTEPIKENDSKAGQLQDARQLVQWAYKAKKGDVSESFDMGSGNQFIVATLDKINSKGEMDVASARPKCEAIIKNKKKAAIIIKKIGTNATLESVATANNKQVQQLGADSSLTMASQFINGLGVESKLIGAVFNKDYQTKVSPPIEGTSGVYLLKVNGIQPKIDETPDKMEARVTARKKALRDEINHWYEGLRKLADVKDSRSEHF